MLAIRWSIGSYLYHQPLAPRISVERSGMVLPQGVGYRLHGRNSCSIEAQVAATAAHRLRDTCDNAIEIGAGLDC
jgi:hypothetical protein